MPHQIAQKENRANKPGNIASSYSPHICCVLVCKSQEICSSARALTDHHWDSWSVSYILPNHKDRIWASFHYQPNHWYTLAHSCFKPHTTSYQQHRSQFRSICYKSAKQHRWKKIWEKLQKKGRKPCFQFSHFTSGISRLTFRKPLPLKQKILENPWVRL